MIWLTIVATVVIVLGLEGLTMKLLRLHVCDEPKEHPPRAFEIENPDEIAAERMDEAGFA
jgi:hypothetical protein